MSTDISTNFYLTVLAYKSYVNGSLSLSGPNLKGIEEACLTLPDKEDYRKFCIIPFIFEGIEYKNCIKYEEGQSHWCSTENNENGTTIKRGYCGTSCPLPDGEERCMTDKNDKCIFPFKFNNLTFHSCTWAYSNTAWCSTQVDSSGVHIGGSKGTCGNGCRIPPRPDDAEQKELPWKEFYNVLKDIYYQDLDIDKSLVTSDIQLKYICALSWRKEYIELRRKVANSTGSSYREMCENPAWNGLRRVNTTGVTWPVGIKSVFCRGHRPSQLIRKGTECDNAYHCMDRSDEDGCGASTQEEEDVYAISTLTEYTPIGRQPKINMSNFIESEGGTKLQVKVCDPPTVLYSEVFPSRCPSDDPKIYCNETVERIRIGEECYPYHKLCSNMDPYTNPLYSHPDHISLPELHILGLKSKGG